MAKVDFVAFYTNQIHNDPTFKDALAQAATERDFMALLMKRAKETGHSFEPDDVAEVVVGELAAFLRNFPDKGAQGPAKLTFDGNFFNPLAARVFSIHEQSDAGTCHC